MKKRGQFFILASVILSLVVASLASVGNYVFANKEPEKFYNLGDELKYESGQIIDYSVHKGSDAGVMEGNIDSFNMQVAENILDQDPDMEFYFIYGDKSKVVVDTSYAKEWGGGEVESDISLFIGGTYFERKVEDPERGYYPGETYKEDVIPKPGEEEVNINIGGIEYKFPLWENQQLVLLMKKKIENDTYVNIK